MADDRAYRITVAYDADKTQFVARVPELEVESRAATRAEALSEAEIAIEQKIAGALAEKHPLAPPVDTMPIGATLSVKIADALHRDLLHHARSNGMNAEEYAGQLIARAVGALEGGRWRDRNDRDRDRDRGSQRPGPSNAPADPDAQPRDDRDRDRDQNRGRSGGRGRPREGYRPELDDKANFLEYLRGLEKGGGGGGGGGGRGRR